MTSDPNLSQPEPRNSSSISRKNPRSDSLLRNFAESINDILLDLTTLEVNTMIVNRITGDKFIPWQTYRSIYQLNAATLQRRGCDEETQERYLTLRNKLALEYALLASDPQSDLYDPRMVNYLTAAPERIPLPNPTITPKSDNTAGTELEKIRALLSNSNFVRSLRKVAELKACLDNHEQKLNEMRYKHSNQSSEEIGDPIKTDIIYAQTVIQMDGDVINRYSKEILNHPQKELILKLHHESVDMGEKQWRGIFQFLIDIVNQAAEKSRSFLDFTRR